MSLYRDHLPQLDGSLFLTDGGLETTLIFHEGHELPEFAAFDLLREQAGKDYLSAYLERYIAIAKAARAGFVLESVTWRASADWGAKLGYTPDSLAAANRESIDMLTALRDRHDGEVTPMVISGCIGPRGDGYDPGEIMSPDDAQAYHATQIETFAATDADMVTAMTITNVPEAIGIARAAQAAGMPCVLSFTVETDGRLPTGDRLGEAITAVDEAPGGAPAYYMINCAHPSHFAAVLETGEAWVGRLRGIRANASACSHAELDEATELDDGDPVQLGRDYSALLGRHQQINVLGGCCGTDHRHVEAISKAVLVAA